jgi:hypothetical protein
VHARLGCELLVAVICKGALSCRALVHINDAVRLRAQNAVWAVPPQGALLLETGVVTPTATATIRLHHLGTYVRLSIKAAAQLQHVHDCAWSAPAAITPGGQT